MEYRPCYVQPFSLSEAVQLDVAVLTEEIARLQNSLQHLKRTQEQLEEATASDPDPEFTKAIEENSLVIGSQEERINILKMALAEKGVVAGSHYDLHTPRTAAATTDPHPPNAPSEAPDDDAGIHL